MIINIFILILYIMACIYCTYNIKKTGVKKNLFQIIFLLVIFLLNLYYYRPLTLKDIVGSAKYSELSDRSAEVVSEKINNPVLEKASVLPNLKNILIRRSIKDYKDKKINSKYKKIIMLLEIIMKI